jgi:hypothetical protein
MEASEKPQLPLDNGAHDGAVRAIDDRRVTVTDDGLEIKALTISDERAARVVRERAEAGQPPPHTVAKAVEIGARVLESEGAAANVDYVNSEFERQMGSLAEKLATTLEAGNEELGERLAAVFGADRSDSVQQQLREMLIKANEHQRMELIRLFNVEDGANPLNDFKSAVLRDVGELKTSQEVQRAEDRKRIEALTAELTKLRERLGAKEELEAEQERGTAKGIAFEDRVSAVIGRIAAARGDVAHHVGDEQGAGGSKKGDVLVEIGAAEGPACGRIVFEVKDSRLAKTKAWAELNGAIAAREAAFAVLVVAGDASIPPEREQLLEYEGNKLIVAVDPDEPDKGGLEVAYRYARLRVLLNRDTELSVDAAGVRDAAGEARASLDALKGIKSALTKATNNVDQAKVSIEGMVAIVLDRLERIESLVSDAAD